MVCANANWNPFGHLGSYFLDESRWYILFMLEELVFPYYRHIPYSMFIVYTFILCAKCFHCSNKFDLKFSFHGLVLNMLINPEVFFMYWKTSFSCHYRYIPSSMFSSQHFFIKCKIHMRLPQFKFEILFGYLGSKYPNERNGIFGLFKRNHTLVNKGIFPFLCLSPIPLTALLFYEQKKKHHPIC